MRANLILGILGSVITITVLFEMMRRHRLREKYAVFWFLVALITLVIAAFPGLLIWLATAIGVQVPANLLFFLASMLLLMVSIQHSHELGRLEERTRTLAEETALLRLDLELLRSEGPDGDKGIRPTGGLRPGLHDTGDEA